MVAVQNRGINVGDVSMDLEKLMGLKETTVGELTGGIEYLFKKNGVDYHKGLGTITSATEVTCTGADGTVEALPTKNILIACVGSSDCRGPFLLQPPRPKPLWHVNAAWLCAHLDSGRARR
eukprot:COSAG01_NODE_7682_length_3100_cov_5.265245_2_plen_121_part_00